MSKPLENVSILVVDDEPDIREIIREELELVGAKITEAACGNDAIKLVQRENFDLIVTDANMPNGNGMELLQAIRAQNPKIPFVVFITGQSDFSQAQAYGEGAAAILSKPTEFPELIAIIQHLVTPAEKRWTRRAERITTLAPVIVDVGDLKSASTAKILDIGQGGMFVHQTNQFPRVGLSIDFEISFEKDNDLKSLKGAGVVRWVRTKEVPPLQPGFGVEFTEIVDLPAFVEFLGHLKTKAYIPMG